MHSNTATDDERKRAKEKIRKQGETEKEIEKNE